jgi:anti-sigma B factor antagonist
VAMTEAGVDVAGDYPIRVGESLAARVAAVDGGAELALAGDIDLATTDALEELIGATEEGMPGPLTIDMREVTFLDSTGLRVLIDAQRRARGRHPFAVRVDPGPVRRLIEAVGLIEALGVREDPGAA